MVPDWNNSMSIEINEMIVNATIEEDQAVESKPNSDDLHWGLEAMKAQIIADCRNLFYELLDKQGDR